MRYASLLPPLLLALTVAACARQQPAYYVTNSVTGQRVSSGQQASPNDGRGLMAAGGSQASGANSYASAAPEQAGNSSRGLFNSDTFDSGAFQTSWFERPSRAPTYAVQAQPQPQAQYTPQPQPQYAPQTYSYQPPRQPAYAPRHTYAQQPAYTQQQTYAQPQPATMQYHPPQPVSQQPYTQQQYYRPPQAQQTSYYTARYGLY